MRRDDTEITVDCAEGDDSDHRLTFAEAGESIGANAPSVRMDDELWGARAALDEFGPPPMQAFQRD